MTKEQIELCENDPDVSCTGICIPISVARSGVNAWNKVCSGKHQFPSAYFSGNCFVHTSCSEFIGIAKKEREDRDQLRSG